MYVYFIVPYNNCIYSFPDCVLQYFVNCRWLGDRVHLLIQIFYFCNLIFEMNEDDKDGTSVKITFLFIITSDCQS